MRKILILLLFLLAGFTDSALAQQAKLSTSSRKAADLYYKADKYFRARDFDRALKSLNAATAKDPQFGEAYIKAANMYKILGDKEAAFKNLQQGLSVLPYSPARANEYYNLAGMYFDRGAYAGAKENYELFLKANSRNSKLADLAQKQIKITDFALKEMQNPVNFNPEKLPAPINKFGMQYFPYTTADQRHFIFTARQSAYPGHDENIYVSQWEGEGWQDPVSISELINTPAQEGAATISGDGKTLVFTSCNRPDSSGDCDLYISQRTGNDWSKPLNMGNTVNSRAWDSQPSLSADGRTLYFTSTRGGGKGQEDIWVTYLQDDGNWLKPVNLGAPINTEGRDMAPFIHASGSTLYFVSDGHPGLGGLDAFMATYNPQNKWSEPKNMGYPLNTHADEGSLFITPDNQTGYYSRMTQAEAIEAVGVHLYKFEVPDIWKSNARSTYAQGRVYDSVTKKPLSGTVQLYNVKTDSLVQQVSSDKVSGEYTVVLTEGKQYALYVSAPNYMMNSLSFDYTSSQDLAPLMLDVYLDPIKPGAAVVLNNLFFGTGEYTLVQDSKTELNKIVRFMQQNDKVKVEISGHTDDVGSDAANQLLSERRAKAVVVYLAEKGIAKERIRYKGYGETKPVKPNTTDDNRSLNRRIEMQVL